VTDPLITAAPSTAVPSTAAPTTEPGSGAGDLADRVAVAVLAVRGVDALHGGTFGETATYLPGRRVTGIRLGSDATEVHVTLVFGVPVRQTAEQIRLAVAAVSPGPVHVTVEDVVPVDSARDAAP